MTRIRIGDLAPAFTAADTEGTPVALADFIGTKALVLFFYPADESPVCTREACAFRDAYEDFVAAGAEVIGVSGDPPQSHREFAAHHRLPFRLISDEEGGLRRAFGVQKTLGLLPGRVTYLIDREGIVRHLFSAQLHADRHVTEALEVLRRMEGEEQGERIMTERLETATLAAGCFWCVEAVFSRLRGVEQAVSGYAGGAVENPTYNEVCSGTTGHAEAVQITFDPAVISLAELLEVFWRTHDPTTLNRQGADSGTQYRSAIFYHDGRQKEIAERSRREAGEAGLWADPIVTEIVPFTSFYAAEGYHQDYYSLNAMQPYCRMVIAPKIRKLQKAFAEKLKTPRA